MAKASWPTASSRVLKMVYKPNIPLPGDNLSVSQGDINNNFLDANASFGVDHYPFDDATLNNGRHKPVHIVKELVNPVPVVGQQIVFTKDYLPDYTGATPDTQLYTITELGGVSQLSGNASTGTEGWNWSGGVLHQWGFVAMASGTGTSDHREGTVTFKDRSLFMIPFPTQCFFVVTTVTIANQASTSPASNTVSIFSKSATEFKWTFNTTGNITSQPGFYWYAIGV